MFDAENTASSLFHHIQHGESIQHPESLLTVGEIARRLDTQVHRIEYVIRSRDIQPIGWAGHARVFPDASVGRIAGELARIKANRTGASAGGCHHEGV